MPSASHPKRTYSGDHVGTQDQATADSSFLTRPKHLAAGTLLDRLGEAWLRRSSGLRLGAREGKLQTGFQPGHSSFQVIDGALSHIDASPSVPRRPWSAAAAEDRIVAEASVPGVNPSALARLHRLSPQQVFIWCREAVRGAYHGNDGVAGTAFAEVRVRGSTGNVHSGGGRRLQGATRSGSLSWRRGVRLA